MDAKTLILCVLFSAFTISLCNKPIWKKCGEEEYKGNVTEVDTNASLDGQKHIILEKGTNVTVSFPFKMINGTVQSATAVVHGIIAEVPVPFPIPNPNACMNSGLSCPLSSPGNYNYTAVVPVKSEYPSITLVVEWELKDQDGNVIWCVEIPATIEG